MAKPIAMNKSPSLFRGSVGDNTAQLCGDSIIINHYKDPYETTSIMRGWFRRIFLLISCVSIQPWKLDLVLNWNCTDDCG